MSQQKGFGLVGILIAVLIVGISAGAIYTYSTKNTKQQKAIGDIKDAMENIAQNGENALINKNAQDNLDAIDGIEVTNPILESDQDSSVDKQPQELPVPSEGDAQVSQPSESVVEQTQPQPDSQPVMQFSGTRLAGTASAPLLDFNQSDYQKALASDKLIVLYFYASWCPICKAELPELYGAFDSLTTSDVVGFRVNFNDSDTDANEKDLARKHGVAYQHTKVLVKDGAQIYKAPDSWKQARYISEITSRL